MRRGAGLEPNVSPEPEIGNQLRQLAGQLSNTEADAIDRVISESRREDVTLRR